MSTEQGSEQSFQVGDRVEMTDDAYRVGLEGRAGRPCRGVVLRVSDSGHIVVRRDGYKGADRYHPDFWRLAPDSPPEAP